MEHSENRKTPQELTDGALDAVFGGTGSIGPGMGTPHVLTPEELLELLEGDKSGGQEKPRLGVDT